MNPGPSDRVGRASLRSDACGVPTRSDEPGTPAVPKGPRPGVLRQAAFQRHRAPEALMSTTPITRTDLARTEVTESDTRATRLQVLEAQVCEVRDDLADAAASADPAQALGAVEQLATLLQHTLQELAHLAWETSPR